MPKCILGKSLQFAIPEFTVIGIHQKSLFFLLKGALKIIQGNIYLRTKLDSSFSKNAY